MRAFGLGQLAGAAASAVEDHVSHCPECCQTLESVGADTLIHLVQAVAFSDKAGGNRTPGPMAFDSGADP